MEELRKKEKKKIVEKIHGRFVSMLLKKNKDWILPYDKAFRIVKAKRSGVFKRNCVSTRDRWEGFAACFFPFDYRSAINYAGRKLLETAQYFQFFDFYSSYGEYRNICEMYERRNVEESDIYIVPDLPFVGEDCFEILFKVGEDGKVRAA